MKVRNDDCDRSAGCCQMGEYFVPVFARLRSPTVPSSSTTRTSKS